MQDSREKRSSKRSKAVSLERILVGIARVRVHLNQNRARLRANVTKNDHMWPSGNSLRIPARKVQATPTNKVEGQT